MAAMMSTSVVVRGIPNASTVTPPTKTCSTRFARRTSSAILRTPSRLRLLGGMSQAPSGFDELEPQVQRLPRRESARSDGGIGEGAEPSLRSAPALSESLHVGRSPHAVLDDSSCRMKLFRLSKGEYRAPDPRSSLRPPFHRIPLSPQCRRTRWSRVDRRLGGARRPLYNRAPITGPIEMSGDKPLRRPPVHVLVPVLGLVYVRLLLVIIAS